MTLKQKIFYFVIVIAEFLITGPLLVLIRWISDNFPQIDWGSIYFLLVAYLFALPFIGIAVGVLSYKITHKVIFAPLMMLVSGAISVFMAILWFGWDTKGLLYPNVASYTAYVIPIAVFLTAFFVKLRAKKRKKE